MTQEMKKKKGKVDANAGVTEEGEKNKGKKERNDTAGGQVAGKRKRQDILEDPATAR